MRENFMDNNRFEKIMNKWLSHEIESAPKLHPTEEMYAKIRGKSKRTGIKIFARPVWGMTVGLAAAVIFLVVLFPSIFQKTINFDSILDLREGVELGRCRRDSLANKEPVIEEEKAEKGAEKKREDVFTQLSLQSQLPGAPAIKEVNIQEKRDEIINLSLDENYRLVLQLSQDRFVYIFQMDSRKRILRLFPEKKFSSIENPLKKDKLYVVPSSAQWFHLLETAEEETVFVIATAEPQLEWDELYSQYSTLRKKSKKNESLQQLFDEWESLEQEQNLDAMIYKFSFVRK